MDNIKIKKGICVIKLKSRIYPINSIKSTAKDFEDAGSVEIQESNDFIEIKISPKSGLSPKKIGYNFFDCLLCKIQNDELD